MYFQTLVSLCQQEIGFERVMQSLTLWSSRSNKSRVSGSDTYRTDCNLVQIQGVQNGTGKGKQKVLPFMCDAFNPAASAT